MSIRGRLPKGETPPRMRGRLGKAWKAAEKKGNTPAYAGKTSIALTLAEMKGKHPRVCGEDRGTALALELVLETPPRMRGRLRQGFTFCKIR